MRVLLVDDHEIVRTGLKHLLESHKSVKKIFEATTGFEALKMMKEEKLDLVILDISMPDLSGLEVLGKADNIEGQTKYLVLSMYPEREYALRALKAGASGYITKDSAAEELHLAIDSVLEGEKYVSKNLRNIILDLKTDKAPHEKLSERESKVFLLLSKGKRNQEIADELFISIKTVSTYKSRIFEKMHLTTVQELTKYAIRHNLIE